VQIGLPLGARQPAAERVESVAILGESLARLRLLGEEPVRQMQRSLALRGQLTPLAIVARGDGVLEIIDGLKRLRAARDLGWAELRVRELRLEPVEAKAAMWVLNQGRGLTELEEAWLVRSLYREDQVPQPHIARLLGRDKSWVSRRLLLAEELSQVVEGDVRLGLLAVRAAVELARLPRGNQAVVAEVVVRRGLTCAQTARLVTAWLACEDEASRTALLAQANELEAGRSPARRPARTHAEEILGDVGTLTRTAARLQARLTARPLAALGERASSLVADALRGLAPVLAALGGTLEHLTRKEPSPNAAVAQP